jgi:pseudouridine-5'-phosphate glycosidase
MSRRLEVRPEVATALAAGSAVVALESTVVAHGLPPPDNLETALAMEARVRAAGATPATVGLIEGRLVVGLSPEELARFAAAETPVAKVSRRDLAPVLAAGGLGATTVAATLVAARLAGIRVFATGGIGGVHPGGENSLDVSADLQALARNPVAVVAAGAKSILDLPRTLELLETLGVPVVGYGCRNLPAFYCRDSGLELAAEVAGPAEAAALLAAHWDLGLEGGVLIAAPIPAADALPETEVAAWIARAEAEAAAEGIAGKALTPFLLSRLHALSDGRTLAANRALLLNNAAIAAEIAVALTQADN